MSKPADILRARKALCLRIAESLERQFTLQRAAYDVDEAADVIDGELPLAHAEAEAQCAEVEAAMAALEPSGPPVPSRLQRLRDALGHDRGVNLGDSLDGAIERIERCKQAEALLREALGQLQLHDEEYRHVTTAGMKQRIVDFLEGK